MPTETNKPQSTPNRERPNPNQDPARKSDPDRQRTDNQNMSGKDCGC